MDKEQKAIMRLQEGEMMSKQYYNAPLMICYSGGKDSDVLVQLAINSGIDFEVVHSIYEDIHRNREKRIILNNDNDDKRKLFERCEIQAKTIVNPIIDWSDEDIWDYINSMHISCNPLYECGFNRVGCVGCPMAGKKRYKEFAKYPKYEQLYKHAFDRMLKRRAAEGKEAWKGNNAEYVFNWWMGENPDQMRIDDMYDEE